MKPLELIIEDLSEINRAVEVLFEYANERKKFVLQGEIGAGKTTLIKAMAAYLGVKEKVTSPTFSLINQYSFKEEESDQEQVVYHLDLYRLNNLGEALDIGIEELLANDAYCFIEWPELIQTLLPEDLIVIKIEVEKNSRRKILFL